MNNEAGAWVTAVYRYEPDYEAFAGLQCSPETSARLAAQPFDGTPISADWQPLEVWLEPRGKSRSTFPGFPEVVVSAEGVEAFGDVFESAGELLPLESEDGQFYVLNVLSIVDCLDEKASRGRRFSTGRFMWIHEHVFNPESLAGATIFKIPQLLRGSATYMTKGFVDSVVEAGLTGLAPVEVWSELEGPRYFGVTAPR